MFKTDEIQEFFIILLTGESPIMAQEHLLDVCLFGKRNLKKIERLVYINVINFSLEMLFQQNVSFKKKSKNWFSVLSVLWLILLLKIWKAEEGSKPKSRHLDFLDILLTAKDENSQGLTSLEIRNEVDTFLFEGKIDNDHQQKQYFIFFDWSVL